MGVEAPMTVLLACRLGLSSNVMYRNATCMLSEGNMAKGLFVCFVSLVLATIGQDPILGFPRFTFGNYQLSGGINTVAVLIGLFSLPEVFNMIKHMHDPKQEVGQVTSLKTPWNEVRANTVNLLRSTIIGIIIGIIPAAGPDIASFLAYNEAKKASKHPEMFGKGTAEGLCASESANNGVTGGSLIPLLTLGIPGSAPAAIFLGAMAPTTGIPTNKRMRKNNSIMRLDMGVKLFQDKMIQGFCFVPLNKAGMKEAGCTYESEHHYMAHLFGCSDKPFGEINVVDNLWTTRTTSHIPIKEVSQNLTIEKIFRAITLADVSLKSSGIAHPRIGIAALNPHCGENGLCGREEIDVIAPAIQKAKDAGMDVYGPFPSDILFIKAFRGDFNGVVTMALMQNQVEALTGIKTISSPSLCQLEVKDWFDQRGKA